MNIERIATYLPAVIAIAFLAALVYCSGKFAYADGDWLQALTISDIFSTSWRALPFSALGVLSGLLIDVKSMPRVLSEEELKVSVKSWSLVRNISSATLSIFSITFVVGSIFFFLPFASSVLPPERSHLISLWAILFSVSVVVVMLRFISKINLNMGTIIVWSTILFSLSYSNGFLAGGSAAVTPRTDHILFRDGSETCGSVLYAGERGIIYFGPEGRQTSMQGWDRIARISTQWPSCKPTD